MRPRKIPQDPAIKMTKRSISEFQRFISKVRIAENGCWDWEGYLTPKGYGMFRADDKVRSVHRWFYFKYKVLGLSDWSDLEIDHLCRNRKCVNPDHLELVTRDENYKRGLGPTVHSRKTHCPSGHEYSVENTRIKLIGRSRKRVCRKCARDYAKNRRMVSLWQKSA